MRASPPDDDDKVLGRLARFAVGPQRATDTDILCLMILLHTHQLTFARPILPSMPNVKELCARTQREAAAIAACAFPQHSPTELYGMLNTAPGAGSFEVMDDVPPDLAARVMTLRAKLLTHPDVILVDPDD